MLSSEYYKIVTISDVLKTFFLQGNSKEGDSFSKTVVNFTISAPTRTCTENVVGYSFNICDGIALFIKPFFICDLQNIRAICRECVLSFPASYTGGHFLVIPPRHPVMQTELFYITVGRYWDGVLR